MQVAFAAAVHRISIPKLSGSGLSIGDNLNLTTDFGFIARKFLSDSMIPQIGMLEFDSLSSAPAILYSVEELEANQFDPIDYLTQQLRQAASFLFSLWLEKDNAADIELGFLFCTSLVGTQEVSSNFLAVRYRKADGTYETSKFDNEDLSRAAENFGIINRSTDGESGPKIIALHKKTSRFERATYWTQAARTANDTAGCIATYCTAFESLAGSSDSELTHQLSERVAYLLGGTVDDRLTIYRTMKKAYRIRSQVVHGESIDTKKQAEIVTLSVALDEYLRKILAGILRCDELQNLFFMSPDSFRDAMNAMILGKPFESWRPHFDVATNSVDQPK